MISFSCGSAIKLTHLAIVAVIKTNRQRSRQTHASNILEILRKQNVNFISA